MKIVLELFIIYGKNIKPIIDTNTKDYFNLSIRYNLYTAKMTDK